MLLIALQGLVIGLPVPQYGPPMGINPAHYATRQYHGHRQFQHPSYGWVDYRRGPSGLQYYHNNQWTSDNAIRSIANAIADAIDGDDYDDERYDDRYDDRYDGYNHPLAQHDRYNHPLAQHHASLTSYDYQSGYSKYSTGTSASEFDIGYQQTLLYAGGIFDTQRRDFDLPRYRVFDNTLQCFDNGNWYNYRWYQNRHEVYVENTWRTWSNPLDRIFFDLLSQLDGKSRIYHRDVNDWRDYRWENKGQYFENNNWADWPNKYEPYYTPVYRTRNGNCVGYDNVHDNHPDRHHDDHRDRHHDDHENRRDRDHNRRNKKRRKKFLGLFKRNRACYEIYDERCPGGWCEYREEGESIRVYRDNNWIDWDGPTYQYRVAQGRLQVYQRTTKSWTFYRYTNGRRQYFDQGGNDWRDFSVQNVHFGILGTVFNRLFGF
jgi:hypothetical protein